MRQFEGKTVICVGGGPSLTDADCRTVEASGYPIIAVNTSWLKVRSAQIIFAGDQAWWDHNTASIDVSAQRWTCNHSASMKHNINLFRCKGRHWNSGLRAIELAEVEGAARVILLGYDCSIRKGVHHHGPHPKTSNPTATVCASWKEQFANLARTTKIQIINCSRDTVLTCFERMELEEALCLKHSLAETPPKTNSSCVVS